jgi:hypothetical protein
VEELCVFIGAIIYMGVHKEPQIEMYWNIDFNKGPLHSISKHIFVALNRSNDIAISPALRVIKEADITYLLIRSGGIR